MHQAKASYWGQWLAAFLVGLGAIGHSIYEQPAHSGNQEFLSPGPHSTHRGRPQGAVQRGDSLDRDV